MTTLSVDQRDDALLAELTGAPQQWLALCREAVADGPEATRRLTERRRETGVLARQSLARWKTLDAVDDPLEEESEEPDLQSGRVTADVSAANAMASLAQAVTGGLDLARACAIFLDHAERAGLHSVGTQLLPAGPVTSDDTPLAAVVLHLLGQGGRPARGYGVLTALELTAQRPATVRVTRVSVLFIDICGRGQVGVLRLEQVRGGPSGLHPDPARMGFLQADREFVDSLDRAWRVSRLADTDACVLWSVSGKAHAPANDINGPSMGAAIAVALDDLAPRPHVLRWLRPRRLDPACAVTAGLSGTSLTVVGGYEGKLAAAQRASLRVVVATAGHDEATEQAPQNYTDRISTARTVSEAIARTRTRANLAPWLVSIAGVLAVLLTVVAVTNIVQTRIENAAAMAEANSRLFAGVARGNADFDPALSQLLALSAYRTSPTVDARSALLETSGVSTPTRISPGAVLGQDAAGVDVPRVATTVDGDMIATGRGDGTVELVRVTGTGVDRWPRFDTGGGPVRSLALSANQQWLVVAGDREAALWTLADPGTPRLATRLPLDGQLPWSTAFSPDLGFLAIGTHGGTVLTWRLGDDPARPSALPTVVVAGQYAEVALSDRALVAAVPLATGSAWATTVRGWDTATFEHDPTPAFDRRLDGPHGAQARSAEFSADGSVLAVGLNPGEVARWRLGADLTRPEPMASAPRGANEYFDVSLDRNGQTAAVVGGDSRARVVDLGTGAELAVFPSGSVARARFLRGDRSLVTIGADQAVHVFELPGPTASTEPLTVFRLPADQPEPAPGVLPAALFPRLRALSALSPGATRNPVDGDPAGFLDTVAVSPDGTRAAMLTKYAIQVWDTSDPATSVPLGPPISNGLVDARGMAFAPDGTLAIGRGLTESVEFWEVTGPGGPTLRSSLRFGRGYPTALTFSPDGSTLAVGSHRTGNVSVYTVHGAPLAELSGLPPHGQDITLALSNRGTLAVGTRDGAFLYELRGQATPPRRLPTPAGTSGPVGALTFDPAGTRLALDDTASGRILLWDYTDPDEPTVYAALDRAERHWQRTMLAFAAGGSILTESAADGTVRRWSTDAEVEARRICASGTAPITPAEWTRALPGREHVIACPGN
ncbi:WD40 repeat domain-containing protein [Nocardia sp. NPDC058176]|uniref:WD40 repeat domain-containing protein n=1 Tax=Nocardia sp. NPDC058176 TaxID=3346368 RepID=UPI0036DD5F6E